MNAQTNSSLLSDDSLFFQKQVANGQRLPFSAGDARGRHVF